MAPETCRTSPISGTLSLYTHLHTPRRPCMAHPPNSHAFPHMHATQAHPQLPASQELALTPLPELYRPLSPTSPAPLPNLSSTPGSFWLPYAQFLHRENRKAWNAQVPLRGQGRRAGKHFVHGLLTLLSAQLRVSRAPKFNFVNGSL